VETAAGAANSQYDTRLKPVLTSTADCRFVKCSTIVMTESLKTNFNNNNTNNTNNNTNNTNNNYHHSHQHHQPNNAELMIV